MNEVRSDILKRSLYKIFEYMKILKFLKVNLQNYLKMMLKILTILRIIF